MLVQNRRFKSSWCGIVRIQREKVRMSNMLHHAIVCIRWNSGDERVDGKRIKPLQTDWIEIGI